MLSLQRNLSKKETGLSLYETMFVWNEFLTRGIRNQLKNSVWTVALVYGFFQQVITGVYLLLSIYDCIIFEFLLSKLFINTDLIPLF